MKIDGRLHVVGLSDSQTRRKTNLAAVFYGVSSVVGEGTGVIALALGLPALGVSLILFGVAGSGWSCFVRGWALKR